MDLRVDLHIFTELCEAARRKEPLILHGHDAKGGVVRVEIPAEAVAQMVLVKPVAKVGG